MAGQNSPRSGEFATTVYGGFRDPRFAARAVDIPVPRLLEKLPRGRFRFWDEWTLLLRVLKAAWKENAILLFSSRGYYKPELIATILIGFWPRHFRPAVVFYGEMYQPNLGLCNFFERLAMKLVDRAVTLYVVYSEDDRDSFARTWGVHPDRIRVCLYYTFHTREEGTPPERKRGRHIFAGGNSFRDYTPLLEAARRMPENEFVLCTTRLPLNGNYPPNVRVGPVPLEEYQRLINTAAVVVLPLKNGLKRSTGMLTYLESMWSKKLSIVTDALGVCEYVRHEETGILVDGTSEGYVKAIQWALDPINQPHIHKIVNRAYAAVVEQFTLENHVTRLLEIMDEVS
ncbi:MAG: glycosyltransferase [Chloroflexi bacterium]|nr:glycosyltransferase [Chloroflexota bacterium]